MFFLSKGEGPDGLFFRCISRMGLHRCSSLMGAESLPPVVRLSRLFEIR